MLWLQSGYIFCCILLICCYRGELEYLISTWRVIVRCYVPFNEISTRNGLPHSPAYHCLSQIQRCLPRPSFTVVPSRTSYTETFNQRTDQRVHPDNSMQLSVRVFVLLGCFLDWKCWNIRLSVHWNCKCCICKNVETYLGLFNKLVTRIESAESRILGCLYLFWNTVKDLFEWTEYSSIEIRAFCCPGIRNIVPVITCKWVKLLQSYCLRHYLFTRKVPQSDCLDFWNQLIQLLLKISLWDRDRDGE